MSERREAGIPPRTSDMITFAQARSRTPLLDEVSAPAVVACSGGPDSLALLALAAAASVLPIAVHVDHGLRPGSDREADVVCRAARRLGTRVRAASVQVRAGSNLEARARDARYRVLEQLRCELDASTVLVGHTMDDQAETVLLNLMRGAAASGLGAMSPLAGTLTRPLLGLRRADTAAICAQLDLDVVHDPTNDDRTFRRAWIRHEVLPLLADGAGRDLVPILARQAELFREESAYLDDRASASWPADHARAHDLAALDPVMARRAVRRWLGAPPPRRSEVDAVLAVARGEHRAAQLTGGRRVWRTAGVMHHEPQRQARDYGVGA